MLCLLRPEVAGRTEDFVLVTADFQTAGRGQRGTTWEAERGKNLLFGLLFRPCGLEAAGQFRLSEAMSLAVAEALGEYVEGITVKWPNDVYVHDRKICGMLLEHDLCGTRIVRTRVGVGVNVNQTVFRGDAPNPVSLRQILGREIDRERLLGDILGRFQERVLRWLPSEPGSCGGETPARADDLAALDRDYAARLYRRSGFHAYCDADGLFQAELAGVRPDGRLVLRDEAGRLRSYAFKEVQFVRENGMPNVPQGTSGGL